MPWVLWDPIGSHTCRLKGIFPGAGPDALPVRACCLPPLTAAGENARYSASEVRLHPSGKFLYTANRGHDSITAFSIDPSNGKLSLIEVESIRGAWPRNFNLDPSGQWLLAAGAQSNTISVFAIDPESGELTFQRGNIINVPGAICVLFP